MLEKILRKMFGDKNTRDLNKYLPQVQLINQIYEGLAQYDDDQLRERVAEIKQEIAEKLSDLREKLEELEIRYREEEDEGERNRIDIQIDETKKALKTLTKSILDDYLPEVYAIVKDTCRRLVGKTLWCEGMKLYGIWFLLMCN